MGEALVAAPYPAAGMRTVTAPDGTQHTIRIEWIGNRLRRAPADLRRRVKRMARAGEYADPGCAPDLGDLFAGIALVILVVVVVVFVLPVAYGLVELAVIVLIAAVIWAFRVLFRRPWKVVQRAVAGDIAEGECLVVGWRRAHAVMVAGATEIAATGRATEAFTGSPGVLPAPSSASAPAPPPADE